MKTSNIVALNVLNDLNNVKTIRRYGCWKGSRLAKATKKSKLSELDVKIYLKWRI